MSDHTDDALAYQEMLEHAVNIVAYMASTQLDSQAHNLGVHLFDGLGINIADADLRKRVAAGVAAAMTAIAEDRDPMIPPLAYTASTPGALLDERQQHPGT
jgi:hypothetical protein